MSRWLRFIVAIVIGAALGLAYGWLVSPVRYVDTSPDTLRIDYKTDYVLMVAEAFSVDGDLQMAVRKLALLGAPAPADIVLQAIEFGQEQGYNQTDIQRMQTLWNALQSVTQPVGIPTP
jgi:hypothetical protein